MVDRVHTGTLACNPCEMFGPSANDDLGESGRFPLIDCSADFVKNSLGEFARAFEVDHDPVRLLESRTRLVDSVVTATVRNSLSPRIRRPLAVLAVGGYGRRELFPFSDVDLLFLLENESDLADIQGPLSETLRICWDTGLRVSHSVRTVAECCRLHEGNIELHISLLDIRFVCGDEQVYGLLGVPLSNFFGRSGTALSQHLARLARTRHAKFNDTVYHLEPNIKEAPGGIRDLHVLSWLARLSPQHTAIQESIAQLEPARSFLFGLRCFLHVRTGRDNNLLSFELQDEVAAQLPVVPESPELWMRRYFQNARLIVQPALRAIDYAEAQDPSLLNRYRDWRGRVSNPEFTVSQDRILLRSPAETSSSSGGLMRLFTFAARHGFRLSWDTQRRLNTDIGAVETLFAEHPAPWTAWREFLSQPHCALALHEMQETGILTAAIPEWRSIDSLVVRDFYHRYTVDEHTLVAIAAIDSLASDKKGGTHRFQNLLREEETPALLRFALLLHDIGKGLTPGDHVTGSVEAAAAIMNRLAMPELDSATVTFLIDNHLILSQIMNARDLDDPATARFLTAQVNTQEKLRRLALLTYADISAVNPTAMTPWRLEQLWRVYTVGVEQLTRELATDRIRGPIPGSPVSEELANFLEGFPTRYVRTHSSDEIAHHFELSNKISRNQAAVEIKKDASAFLLTVLAEDQPGLFARLCGALAGFGMNIVKAEAFSNSAGIILDLLRFTDPMRTLELNPTEVERLQITVERAAKGSLDVRELLKHRRPLPRPSRGSRISPIVRFNNDASDTSTLIEFVGEDRPGLLYDLASALSNERCNIELVMIDTEAHKAIDVLYVTCDDMKLDAAMQSLLGEKLAAAAEPGNV